MYIDKQEVQNEVLKLQWQKPEIASVSCSETEDKDWSWEVEANIFSGPS